MVLELILGALTLLVWYGFLRLLKKGTAVTITRLELFKMQIQTLNAGLAQMGVEMRKLTEAMRSFQEAYSKELQS